MADMEWLTQLIELEQKHDLLVFVRSRDDVEDEIGRKLTDDEWQRIRLTNAWRKGDDDEYVNSLINQIVSDAIAQADITWEGSEYA